MTFPISVYSIDREIFLGQANVLTLPGKEGEFQILKDHAPLIALLKEGDLTIEKEDHSEQKLPIEGGVVEVTSQNVVVLVNF